MTAPVFLSYHTPDRSAVQTVQDELSARGVPTFLDCEDLKAGRSWMKAVEEKIERDARAALIFVGPQGLGPWQEEEAQLALQRSHHEGEERFPVVPVLLPGGTLERGFLSIRHFIDLRSDLRDVAELERLARAIRADEPSFSADAIGYREIDQPTETLVERAKAVLRNLPEAPRRRAPDVLTRMVWLSAPGGSVDDTRRRLRLDELDEVSRAVIEAFAAEQLVVVSHDKQSATLAHKALFREWKALREPLQDDRSFLLWRQWLQERAQGWERGREPLLRGRGLAEAERWQRARSGDLDARERAYVEASRMQRRRRLLLWAVSAVVLVAAALGAVGLLRNRAAWKTLERAQSSGDAHEQLRLAIDALLRFEKLGTTSPEASNVVRQALARLPVPVTPPLVHEGEGKLLAIAFGPRGHRLATAGHRGEAVLWQIPSGRRLAALPHEGRVTAVAFSADRRWLATADENGRVRLWDPDRGEPLRGEPLCCHSRRIRSLAFAPEADLLATAGEDGRACLWDLGTGQRRSCFDHPRPVVDVAFSRDGRSLLTRSQEDLERSLSDDRFEGAIGKGRQACLWAVDGRREPVCVAHGRTEITDAALSPGQEILVTAGEDGTVRTWNAATGESLASFPGGDLPVSAVAFSPDGLYLAAVSFDGTARVWDAGRASAGGWREVAVAKRSETRPIESVEFSPNGRTYATLAGSYAQLWATATGREALRLEHRGIRDVAFSPDGTYLVTAGADDIRVWSMPGATRMGPFLQEIGIDDVATSGDGCYLAAATAAAVELRTTAVELSGRCPSVAPWRHLATLDAPAAAVAFHPGGKLVATVGTGGIRLWELPSAVKPRTVEYERATEVAFSGDGALVATAGYDGTVRVWDLGTEEERALLPHPGAVYGMAFHPTDSRFIVTAAVDGVLRLWRLGSGEPQARSPGGVLRVAAWSADGRYVAAGGDHRRVWLWRSEGEAPRLREEPSRVFEHEGAVVDLAFSPDGLSLASASDGDHDKSVRVWDVGSGRELARIPYPDSSVTALAWSFDGRYLAVASRDRSVRLWPVDSAALVEEARLRGLEIP